MKNNEIELWLRQAAEAEAPDLLDGIMKGIEEGRGRDQNISIIQGDFRRKKKKGLALGSAAAALAMLLGAGFYFSYNYSVDSLIGIDVNPSLELEVSKRERVISARALNGDAETVLSGMDLKNVDLDVAVNAIIGSMLQNGYLSADGNSIFVTVENDDENKGQVLSDSLMPVSYTHLDVYKRQVSVLIRSRSRAPSTAQSLPIQTRPALQRLSH